MKIKKDYCISCVVPKYKGITRRKWSAKYVLNRMYVYTHKDKYVVWVIDEITKEEFYISINKKIFINLLTIELGAINLISVERSIDKFEFEEFDSNFNNYLESV